MKRISTLLIASLLVIAANSQTTYNVTSNKSWNGNYPNSCVNCTFNISANVTLTVDRNITLQNVRFNGGKINVTGNNVMTLQTSGGGSSYFNDTKVNFNGSSRLVASAPLYITNSEFTFNGSSRINSQHLIELSGSRINLYGSSNFTATGGPVNLKNNSLVVAGDGTLGSSSYININGPQLNVYDNSALIVANNNNYYFNWSAYNGASINKSNSTANSTMNCGSGFPHGCANPYVYGPVNLTANGLVRGNILPVKLSEFSATLVNSQIELKWTTDQENNSDRFEVERSIDGIKWVTIAIVKAKGNSTIQSKYQVADKTPAAGINYYRLKMIDLDNTFEYSAVKSLRTTSTQANVRVYPNPAVNNVFVSLPAGASAVRLMNTAGQVLIERKSVIGNSTVTLDVTAYNAGTYMVQVMKADGTAQNSVLIVAK